MKKVVIMGAGPAGLSAGYCLQKSGLKTVMVDADDQVGGISKTIKYKDYYFDLGGHRFFTKIDKVNNIWHEVLGDQFRKTPRLSRIYYKNKFFNYPLTAMNAFLGVGIKDCVLITGSYIKSKLFPYKKEETFEQWVSNRFGKKLYSIFFKTYTEKVWGIPCSDIMAEWAAQRIKGLSLTTAVINAVFKPKGNNIKTLINEFDYPILGPGMMYNSIKDKVVKDGGIVRLNSKVIKVNHTGYNVESIEYADKDGNITVEQGTNFISSIPLTELINILYPKPPEEVLKAAEQLKYRSLLTVDIIINKKVVFPDNWIYIHSPEVKLGRIQNFKNWSDKMVPNQEKTSLGLEYFCNENDDLWNMADEDLFKFASEEVEKINICKASEIEDYVIVRVPKAYPVYDCGYRTHLKTIVDYIKKYNNLQPVGRYGMFKYNNMDHSMLTGVNAAENIINPDLNIDIWQVNTEEEYHEEK
jgi:protoporphyrinogen oxidase